MELKNLVKKNVKVYSLKSQAKIADTIAIVVILALVIIYASLVGSKIFKTIESILTSANPRMLSIEVSSLMTVSGTSPHEIEITYKVPKYTVNISAKDKVLTVENRLLEKYTKPTYNSTFATNFKDFDFENVNTLIIKKRGVDKYDFNAEKK